MHFGTIGRALCILGVLESLDAQEWGLGAENECVVVIPCSGIILEDFLETCWKLILIQ